MIKVKVFGSGSKGNGYLIDDGHSQLMIECGVSFKNVQQKMMFDFSKVVGCLVTHEHRDHCNYVPQFIDSTSIDFYSTQGTFEAMVDDEALKFYKEDYYRFNFMKYKMTYKIGTWFVTPFETKHDVKEPCGFLIDNTSGDRLVFITDSYYVKYQFPRVTHMMVEANYSNEIIDRNLGTDFFQRVLKTRIKSSHFDFENAAKFIEINMSEDLQEVHLLHLSDANSNKKEFKEKIQKLTGVPVYVA